MNAVPLTGLDDFMSADFAVTRADGVHVVLVDLTTANINELTRVAFGPALSHYAIAVHRLGHIVEGVVGGLPAEGDQVAGALVTGPKLSRSTGD